ncbi:MAG: branched-chain amino acid ABC transporter permease [Ilumatobacteraceae bacterium]
MKLAQPKRSSMIFVLFIIAVALSPALLDAPQQSLLTRALIFGLMAASLDIAYGHGGLASLGHSALAGVGGYTVGILSVKHDITSFWIGALAAVGVSAAVSLVFGMLALRAKGIYFILATFALGQMMSNLAQQWKALKSPGVDAIVGINWPSFGFIEDWTPASTLRAVLVIVVVAFLGITRVLGSPFGLALRGVRDNAQRMEALGYHAWAYQLGAMVASGAFAGLAGALFAYHSGIITPSNIGIAASGVLVLMVILGGSDTTYGPLFGGIAVTVIQFYASEWSEARAPLLIGALFIATALVLRGGVAGTIARRVRRRGQTRASA